MKVNPASLRPNGPGQVGGRTCESCRANRATLRFLVGVALTLAILVAPSAVSALSGQDLSRYLRGRTAILDGAFETAAQALKPLASSADSDASVLDLATYSSLLAGHYEDSVTSARYAAERGVYSWPHRLVLFSDRVRESDWKEALALIDGDAPNVWSDLLAAWVEYGAGDIEQGIRRLRRHKAEPVQSPEERSRLQHVVYHLGLLELAAGEELQGLQSLNEAMDFAVPGYRAVLERGSRLETAASEALYLSALRDHPERDVYEALLLGEAEPRLTDGPVEGVAEALLSIAEMTPWVAGRSGSRVPLQIATALRPGDPEISYALGTRLAEIGRYEEAIATLRASGSTARQVRVAEAEALLRSGDFAGAVAVYDELVNADPSEPWLAYSYAELHRRMEDYAAAQEWYSLSLERYENLLAELEAFDVTVVMDGLSLDEWALSGNTSTPVTSSFASIPNLPELRRREYVRLVSDLLRMERLVWPTYFGRGVANERLGEWPKAEADLQRALRISDGNPLVANYLGYYWVDNEMHLEQGLDLLEEALELRPQDPYILDSVGWALYRVGDYSGALGMLEEALQRDPGVAEIYDHFGDVLWMLGYHIEARYQWERALTLDPEEHIRLRAERKVREGL